MNGCLAEAREGTGDSSVARGGHQPPPLRKLLNEKQYHTTSSACKRLQAGFRGAIHSSSSGERESDCAFFCAFEPEQRLETHGLRPVWRSQRKEVVIYAGLRRM
jgi:hypothetical protein